MNGRPVRHEGDPGGSEARRVSGADGGTAWQP
jgi:hypothetical protein